MLNRRIMKLEKKIQNVAVLLVFDQQNLDDLKNILAKYGKDVVIINVVGV